MHNSFYKLTEQQPYSILEVYVKCSYRFFLIPIIPIDYNWRLTRKSTQPYNVVTVINIYAANRANKYNLLVPINI